MNGTCTCYKYREVFDINSFPVKNYESLFTIGFNFKFKKRPVLSLDFRSQSEVHREKHALKLDWAYIHYYIYLCMNTLIYFELTADIQYYATDKEPAYVSVGVQKDQVSFIVISRDGLTDHSLVYIVNEIWLKMALSPKPESVCSSEKCVDVLFVDWYAAAI